MRHAVLTFAIVSIAILGAQAAAQAQPAASAALPSVTVSGKATEDVEKSYRRMIRGMDLFEQRRAQLAPQSTLRFKLLPRRRTTNMGNIQLEILGRTLDEPVPIAADHTFTLARNAQALAEDAVVSPNRASGTMTWRTEIRSPGVPEGMRRLGDLRLECEVGMEARLVSSGATAITKFFNEMKDTPDYCHRKEQHYLFFTERPVFNVELVAGARREPVAIDRLYASALTDPGLAGDLPACDCEVLLDRTYYLPLADPSWPDDTLVRYEYMDD